MFTLVYILLLVKSMRVWYINYESRMDFPKPLTDVFKRKTTTASSFSAGVKKKDEKVLIVSTPSSIIYEHDYTHELVVE